MPNTTTPPVTLSFERRGDYGAGEIIELRADVTDLGTDWRRVLSDEQGVEPAAVFAPAGEPGRYQVVISTERTTVLAGGAIANVNPVGDPEVFYEAAAPTEAGLRELLRYDAGEAGLLTAEWARRDD